jgi:hypothetical protein
MILLLFSGSDVTTFTYDPTTAKFTLNTPKEATELKFQLTEKDSGDCFLAFNETSGVLFDGDKIYFSSSSIQFDRDEATIGGLQNPFYIWGPGGNPHACVETFSQRFFLFFDNDKMYLYDIEEKSHSSIGDLYPN